MNVNTLNGYKCEREREHMARLDLKMREREQAQIIVAAVKKAFSEE